MQFDTDYTLVFLGKLDRYPRDEQLDDCNKAVKEFGLPKFDRAIYEHNEFDNLLHDCRKNELVMLPKIDAIALGRSRGVGKRFLMNVIRLTNETHIILDVKAGISSLDIDQWYDHIERTRNQLVNGRKLSSEEAKLLGKMPKTRNKRGLFKHWTEHVSTEDFNRMAQHWRDPHIKSARDAIASAPDEELRKASQSMWERIFGGRTGRSKKRAKK